MIRMLALALPLGLLLAAGPAHAFHCPMDMAAIDKAMAKNPPLTTEQKAQVMKWRQEGEALHRAGRHGQSVDTLAKAKAMLGIR